MQLEKRHLDAYPSLSTWMKLLWLTTWLVCGEPCCESCRLAPVRLLTMLD